MATIKSFTDLSQSKVLAEILPLESADMHYHYDFDFDKLESIPAITEEDDHFVLFPKDVRCWSLAALLDILPEGKVLINDVHSNKYKVIGYNLDTTDYYDEPLDACYEFILKAHEHKML